MPTFIQLPEARSERQCRDSAELRSTTVSNPVISTANKS